MLRSSLTIESLADRPDLVDPLARLRWQEWADHSGRESLLWWIRTTQGEAGADGVPVTLVAVDAAGDVLGGMGLITVEHDELADRGPWVVGVIVRSDQRGRGIGGALMTSLTTWAADAGYARLWVNAGGRAVDFYRRCGFTITEVLRPPGRDPMTILSRAVPHGREARGR
ncbi:GNAT family N-acetyltransferase [Cryptosporangium aurantiacum]|uniref:Acetyltransferase (GNAT) family protein n=1 Tax=Cryptosporangium aurantiacum TaxID=134849 RepID=A0A1M7TY69_9ACTN|nr:GNAT family N-acetyltransferase [Cryptosporangium aurantiacum]SHN75671.1 Acetyltransferase (GNAT) family protein [Cryptosporangium aurantiacum]